MKNLLKRVCQIGGKKNTIKIPIQEPGQQSAIEFHLRQLALNRAKARQAKTL